MFLFYPIFIHIYKHKYVKSIGATVLFVRHIIISASQKLI